MLALYASSTIFILKKPYLLPIKTCELIVFDSFRLHSFHCFFLCLISRIVRSYLLHYGYEETLKLYDEASENAIPSVPATQENGFSEQESAYAFKERHILRQVCKFCWSWEHHMGCLFVVKGLENWVASVLGHASVCQYKKVL